MKKVMCSFILLALMLTLATGISADEMTVAGNAEIVLLSEMSEEECFAFVRDAGIAFPHSEDDVEFWGAVVKAMICAVEDNPAHIFYYNYSKVRELANNIKILVNAYYGVGDVVVLNAGECETDPESVPTDLVYSELIGSWLDEYGTYNCSLMR